MNCTELISLRREERVEKEKYELKHDRNTQEHCWCVEQETREREEEDKK